VRTHSQSVLPMVQELLAEAGIALADCDAIAFRRRPGLVHRRAHRLRRGPGPGLRRRPAGAAAGDPGRDGRSLPRAQGASEVLAVLDARMGEVYWAQYRNTAPAAVLPPALSAPDGVRPQGAPVACGNGLSAYAEAFPAGGHAAVMPHAAQIAQLAAIAFAEGRTVTAAEAQPLYLRNKIAYTQAERRDMAAAKAAEGGA
jgi:tRNA threonylcarbamoyladenosine biosynthesis protein TsaB